MSHEPSDAELQEFIARFIGPTHAMPHIYTSSVDAWLRDVVPKIREAEDAYLMTYWAIELTKVMKDDSIAPCANADARSRCLSLWRALNGTLPKSQTGADHA